MSTHLLLTYDFPPMGGGIARWMGELAKCYPPGSLVVSTGQHPGGTLTDSRFPNPIDRLPTPARRLRTIHGLVQWSRRATSIARTSEVEFTWCGNIKPAAYPARWTAARAGVPYGILIHGADLLILRRQIQQSVFKRQAARTLLGSASVLVANSRWTAKLCESVVTDLELEVAPKRVRVVRLGCNPQQFRPGVDVSAVRQRHSLTGGRWLITVARLTEHKGIDTGLQVLAQLRDVYPDLGYAIIGSGGDLPRLQQLARSLGVGNRVRFLTNVPDEDLPALYNAAAIYLGLSRELESSVEGFGISLVEAGGCGIPVVAGRSGGTSDAVRENETGLLVDTGGIEPAVAAVRLLLDNGDVARRLGAGGRKAVESFYNWDRVTADVRRIGAELGRRRGSGISTSHGQGGE